jgi:glucose dehydrogenase
MTKSDVNVKDICPAAMGAKNHQPVSYDPNNKLFYVASNHICMDYQAFSVKYKGGFPYVGAILNMFPADHGDVRGRLFAFDAVSGETKWEINDMFQAQRLGHGHSNLVFETFTSAVGVGKVVRIGADSQYFGRGLGGRPRQARRQDDRDNKSSELHKG